MNGSIRILNNDYNHMHSQRQASVSTGKLGNVFGAFWGVWWADDVSCPSVRLRDTEVHGPPIFGKEEAVLGRAETRSGWADRLYAPDPQVTSVDSQGH